MQLCLHDERQHRKRPPAATGHATTLVETMHHADAGPAAVLCRGNADLERESVAKRLFQQRLILRRVVRLFRGRFHFARNGRQRDAQRRRTQYTDDACAFFLRRDVEQLDDFRHAFGGIETCRAHDEFTALAPVHGKAEKLRNDQSGQQHQHHAGKQGARQEAFHASTATSAAST